MLLKVADWLEENIERLVGVDALDIGRTVFELPQDYRQAIGQYRFFAAAVMTHEGWTHSVPGGWAIAKREPYGVVGQIIPWNVPAIMVSFKLAPALAAGNTVVLKPDENASLSTMELAKYLAEVFPPGVVNVVPGFGEEAGEALTAHPDVTKLAFTGSPEVGRIIARAGAARLVEGRPSRACAPVGSAAAACVGEQRHLACVLDGGGDLALLLRCEAGDSTGSDLAAVGDECP